MVRQDHLRKNAIFCEKLWKKIVTMSLKTLGHYGKARRFMEGLAVIIAKVLSYATNVKVVHYDVDIFIPPKFIL